jgi:DNA replication protein DnaC
MHSERTIEEIFSSLQSLAEQRELEETEEQQPKKTSTLCLCGKEYTASNEDAYNYENDAEDIDEDDDSPEKTTEAGEPIYIENTQKGLRYAVCPACNPRLNCQLCDGTGHRILNRVHVFETEDGEFEHVCEDLSPNTCSCTHTERLVTLLNNAEIPSKYVEAEINSFKHNHLTENQTKKLIENIQRVQKLCFQIASTAISQQATNQKYFITLFGPVGSGKTLLAVAALKMVIINFGFTGRFVDFQFLLNQIKAEYDQKKSGEHLLKQLRDVDILIIDELGKGRNENEWQLEKLDDLINSRYNAKKITILTTNYLPQQFKYDEKEIPRTTHNSNYWGDQIKSSIPVHESFWTQTLIQRIGARMYERIYEVSEFIDFTELPSYRKFVGKEFLSLYSSKNK